MRRDGRCELERVGSAMISRRTVASLPSGRRAFVRVTEPHGCQAGIPMSALIIRPARADEYDVVADVWARGWLSNGIGSESASTLAAMMRDRIPHEIANGWSLYVADDAGTVAAMLAF